MVGIALPGNADGREVKAVFCGTGFQPVRNKTSMICEVEMCRLLSVSIGVLCIATLPAQGQTVISMTTRDEEKKAMAALREAPKVKLLAKHSLTYASGLKGDYTLYGPPNVDTKKSYPLVLAADTLAADAFRSETNQAKNPCFVVSFSQPRPQTLPEEKKREWKSLSAAMGKELVERLLKAHNIDPKRVYVTGVSASGGIAWQAAVDFPEVFAAVVPCYATCSDLDKAPKLVEHKVGVWVFHGAASNLVDPAQSNGPRAWVAAIEKAGGKPKYTEYKLLGHTAMGYCEPALMEWLFSQKKP